MKVEIEGLVVDDTEEIDDPRYVMGGTYKPGIADLAREVGIMLSGAVVVDYPVAIDDISSWQGAVNFNAMRQVAQCVYIRAGFGNDGYDLDAQSNAAGAKAAGMPYGLYWYVKVGKDFKKHIANFLNVWQQFGGVLPPVWDIEYTEYNTKDETTNWLTKLVKNWTGATPMIYTRASWWDANTFRTDWPKQYDLWAAHYTSGAQPMIPADWGAIHVPKTWAFWQWSADGNDLGSEHGVSSDDIDRNRFNGSIDAFNKKYSVAIKPLGTVMPPEPPTPPPSTGEIVPLKRVQVIAAKGLNTRSGPGANYKDLGELTNNTVVPVVAEQGDWLRIDGWVHKSYVKTL